MGSRNSPLSGILYMILGLGLLATMDAVAKWLIEHQIHAVQILAARSLIIVPFLFLVYSIKGKTTELKPTRPVAQFARGLSGALSPLAFFTAVSLMPLSTATVIFFSSIFMITMLSMYFLGEKVGAHRWTAIIAGFVGVMIAMSPSGGGNLMGYTLVLCASFGYACLFVSGRYLSRTESVPSLVLSFNLCVGIVMITILPWYWSMTDLRGWVFIVFLAALAGVGHYCVTKAFSSTEASLLAPLEYTAVLWALLYDLTIWHQLPGVMTWIGALVILTSGLYLIHRERLHEKKLIQLLPSEAKNSDTTLATFRMSSRDTSR